MKFEDLIAGEEYSYDEIMGAKSCASCDQPSIWIEKSPRGLSFCDDHFPFINISKLRIVIK